MVHLHGLMEILTLQVQFGYLQYCWWSSNGCDSLVTLDLTINNSVSGTDTQIACGSYTGLMEILTLLSNNSATFNIVGGAANGCDSLVTLDLTINNSVSGTDTQIACGSYMDFDGNTYTTSNNSMTFTPTKCQWM